MIPRISFGMIVLNGEPFTRYNLRAIYPYAYQIIVVEGAIAGNTSNATADGHSLDGTLDVLQAFKREEDPANKLIIVTTDGFWREKDEMSQAYAQYATGDFLWQIDSDEFYLPHDIETILQWLRDDPTISAISFPMINFWGGLNTIVESWFLRTFNNINRIFQWGEGYRYVKHRPPTVLNARGENLHQLHWIRERDLLPKKIYMYHYSLIFPSQVTSKSAYYNRVSWGEWSQMERWAHDNFLHLKNPFRVHNVYQVPSWLKPYRGEHPPQILAMWRDIENGVLQMTRRPTEDVQRLLKSPWYQMARPIVQYSDYIVEVWRIIKRLSNRIIVKIRYELKK